VSPVVDRFIEHVREFTRPMQRKKRGIRFGAQRRR
jgi:hypothetical protein